MFFLCSVSESLRYTHISVTDYATEGWNWFSSSQSDIRLNGKVNEAEREINIWWCDFTLALRAVFVNEKICFLCNARGSRADLRVSSIGHIYNTSSITKSKNPVFHRLSSSRAALSAEAPLRLCRWIAAKREKYRNRIYAGYNNSETHAFFTQSLWTEWNKKEEKNAKLSFKRVDDCRFDSNDFSKSRSFIIFVGSLLWLVAAMADHRRSYIAVVDENSEIFKLLIKSSSSSRCAVRNYFRHQLFSRVMLSSRLENLIWFFDNCKPNLKKKTAQRLFGKKEFCALYNSAAREQRSGHIHRIVCAVCIHIYHIYGGEAINKASRGEKEKRRKKITQNPCPKKNISKKREEEKKTKKKST